MNKLGILAFSLLLFFSAMLWYLAKGSLNEYLKSQIELQAEYYSSLKTTLGTANFSVETNTAELNNLEIYNLPLFKSEKIIIIDKVNVVLAKENSKKMLTFINQATINNILVNIDKKEDNLTNIEKIINKISNTLATDYPQQYPQISAKVYAQNNPELNAEAYAKEHPDSGPIVEHTNQKKSRGKPQQKAIISILKIDNLEINSFINGKSKTEKYQNLTIENIGGEQGIVNNQLGGEILLQLLKLIDKKSTT